MAITAIPNPNYCFVNWTGPVTIPTSPISTVVLQQTQSVRANFAQTVTSAVSTSVLNPSANHDLLSVGLSARTNCASAANVPVQVFGDEDDQTATDSKGTVFSPDATNITLGALKLRAERVDSGDGRVYLIVVRATDAAGNNGFSCNSVVVPHDSSAAALASVNNQAMAARAYCQANGGAPPHGYFVIGDGPLIGPKK